VRVSTDAATRLLIREPCGRRVPGAPQPPSLALEDVDGQEPPLPRPTVPAARTSYPPSRSDRQPAASTIAGRSIQLLCQPIFECPTLPRGPSTRGKPRSGPESARQSAAAPAGHDRTRL